MLDRQQMRQLKIEPSDQAVYKEVLGNWDALAKPLDDSKQSWQPHAVIEDPAGNYLYLWKCPSSRTWDELETEYDEP